MARPPTRVVDPYRGGTLTTRPQRSTRRAAFAGSIAVEPLDVAHPSVLANLAATAPSQTATESLSLLWREAALRSSGEGGPPPIGALGFSPVHDDQA
jgi:hypothetical protein